MTVEQISEMQFGRSDDTDRLEVMNLSDGSVTTAIGDTAGGRSYKLTLGQAIQLRDFLNRHIDELALKQTGSLAVRSSDDPTQLAAVEDVRPRRKKTRSRPLADGQNRVIGGGAGRSLMVIAEREDADTPLVHLSTPAGRKMTLAGCQARQLAEDLYAAIDILPSSK